MTRWLRLRLKMMTFSASVEEVERGPEERYLVVEREVWDTAVSWMQSRGWKGSGPSLMCRNLTSGAVAEFTRYLTEALAEEPEEVKRPRGWFDVERSLRAFFDIPSNRVQLGKVLDLLERGGELVVVDEPEPPARGTSGGRARVKRRVGGDGRAARRRS